MADSTARGVVWETKADIRMRRRWAKRLARLEHIYRYRSLTNFEWIEEIVVHSRLFFPLFPKLNDPFDGNVLIDCDGTRKQIQAYWEAYLIRVGKPLDDAARARIREFVENKDDPATKGRLLAIIQEETNTLGVVCFSELPNDIPMWAYYADSQRGVCLRFSSRRLPMPDNSFDAMPANYVGKYPKCGFYRDSLFRRSQVMLTTKASAWKHEREWRLVRVRGGSHHDFDPGSLDGIILGCRISPENEARIRAMVSRRRPQLQLLRAQPSRDALGLAIVSV